MWIAQLKFKFKLWVAVTPAALLLPMLQTYPAVAQSYPTKPVRMILGLGGGAEIAARLVAQHAGAALGQPIVVVPQSAAGGSLAASTVATSAPDGHTILYAAVQSQVYHTLLTKTTPYDPIKDFTAIVRVGDAVLCIAVHPDTPYRTFKEFIDAARRSPGKIAYSSSGIGTVQHLSGELIKQVAKVDLLHVPFKGGVQQTVSLMNGEVPVSFTILATIMPQINAGKVRILAINNAKRFPGMPNVPTVAEEMPGYELPPGWMAMFGPAGLPELIVRRLNAETIRALSLPEVREKLDQVAINIGTSTPEEMSAFVKRDFERAAALLNSLGIRPE
ncbi:MAG: Bug family tripartite tricarboxylate transporter substrate binding protein [Burkholderiales bacterium]